MVWGWVIKLIVGVSITYDKDSLFKVEWPSPKIRSSHPGTYKVTCAGSWHSLGSPPTQQQSPPGLYKCLVGNSAKPSLATSTAKREQPDIYTDKYHTQSIYISPLPSSNPMTVHLLYCIHIFWPQEQPQPQPVGGFNPFETYDRQIGNHFPQFSGWKEKKHLKPPPRQPTGPTEQRLSATKETEVQFSVLHSQTLPSSPTRGVLRLKFKEDRKICVLWGSGYLVTDYM